GVALTCGITPAHFMLSDLATADFRTFTRLSPPLRKEADRQAAIEAIGEGVVDVIASGHDPRGPEDKRLPFADAEPGMAGAETLLAMTLTLVRDGVIDTARAFELLATNPARILGVPAGALTVGLEADVARVEPDAPWIIDRTKMEATADNTPFDRQGAQGRVRGLIKGGVEVAV
ncbi:MAG: amidohydrolase family protein, partial [Pseudomonadota bacterium]